MVGLKTLDCRAPCGGAGAVAQLLNGPTLVAKLIDAGLPLVLMLPVRKLRLAEPVPEPPFKSEGTTPCGVETYLVAAGPLPTNPIFSQLYQSSLREAWARSARSLLQAQLIYIKL
uniref:Uncharacterized protein n=1 Tax=Romanomermis culicivorax TaxID=13658 RepID=A0A915I9K3_ROMCU